MLFKERIKKELDGALKNRNDISVSTLRMLLAAIIAREKEKRYRIFKEDEGLQEKEIQEKSELSEKEFVEVVEKEIKKRKEAILAFEKGKRQDLAGKEKEEMEVLQKYLPEQISDQELVNIAKEAIKKVGAKEIKDIGKVMAEIMQNVRGKAQGGRVNQVVKELLETNS